MEKTLSPVVKTTTGELRGFVDRQSRQSCFFGIPYAEPPVGPLRFKVPVAKKAWAGTFDATAFGASGPQVFDHTEGSYEEFTGQAYDPEQKPWVGSEDNLTLNIWTPAADGKKRPVMVWIHGGANWLESSRLATYHGDQFVERGDVVFVSINYRLGIFGWLDVSVLGGEEYAGSHSNGLRDQLCALQWIKENVEAFGGDADNITVMGESAGSIDLSWLLTNGKLNGIAKRVVMMSGVAGLPGASGDLEHGFSEDYAREQSRLFLDKMGIDSFDQLIKGSTSDLMDRVSNVARTNDMLFVMDSQFWPRNTPDFAPLDPFRAARRSGSHGIDVLIGYTSYEMGLWLFWDDELDRRPLSWTAERLTYPDRALFTDKAREVYAKAFPGEPEGVLGMNIMGDSMFVIPTYRFADTLADKGENVWVYQFDWRGNDRQRALHAADQAFMFGKLETHAASHLLGKPKNEADAAARRRLSQAVMDSVLSFARTGEPSRAEGNILPVWPRYETKNRPVMSFDYESRVENDPAAERRAWWYQYEYEAIGQPAENKHNY